MPPKSQTLPDGVNRLIKLVAHLNSAPKLTLPTVKNLRICLAAKHDHHGPNTFVKQDLPRIRYANPEIGVEVKRVLVGNRPRFRATMDVELVDGTKREFDIQGKWSSAIVRELMDTAGGDKWTRYKDAAKADHLPVLPGQSAEVVKGRMVAKKTAEDGQETTEDGKETTEGATTTTKDEKKLPTLDEWIAKYGEPEAPPLFGKKAKEAKKKAQEEAAAAAAKAAEEALLRAEEAEVTTEAAPETAPEPTPEPAKAASSS